MKNSYATISTFFAWGLFFYYFIWFNNVVIENFYFFIENFNHIKVFWKTSNKKFFILHSTFFIQEKSLQKGGVPAAPSGTATLLRLSPSHQFYPRSLLTVTNFRYPRLPWLDGRCVQGPGTYSPRHGWCAITSESSFKESSCRLLSELRRVLRD